MIIYCMPDPMHKENMTIAHSRCFSCLFALPLSVYLVRSRRGRDAGYPTPPAQIPACGFPAPGSSVVLASAVLIALDIAILLREVGLCAPVRHVRHKFPVRTAYHRQPLPRVVGSPALKVLWVDPTPWRPSAPLLGVTYLSETGAVRVSQVPDASLHAYHALKWTPADPRAAHQHAASV